MLSTNEKSDVDNFGIKYFYSICSFVVYGATSVMKRSTSSCCIPLSRNKNNALSNGFGERLDFYNMSHASKNIFPDLSVSKVPITTFAMYRSVASVISSIDTQIFFPITCFRISFVVTLVTLVNVWFFQWYNRRYIFSGVFFRNGNVYFLIFLKGYSLATMSCLDFRQTWTFPVYWSIIVEILIYSRFND